MESTSQVASTYMRGPDGGHFGSGLHQEFLERYVYVLLAGTCWAVAGTVAKYMMLQAISPMVLAEMRVTIAAALLAVLLAVKKPALLRRQTP